MLEFHQRVEFESTEFVASCDGALLDYKVKYYAADTSKWYAYFRPRGWPNFGNNVLHGTREDDRCFPTFEGAMDACRKHLETYGPNANPHQKISKGDI